MKFNENLKNMRKKAKMSQEELATKVGVSKQSISRWEKGDIYPEMDNILELCKIFDCKINDLVNDELIDIDSKSNNNVTLDIEDQSRLKVISKIIYIVSKIGKICLIICIPFLLLLMAVAPYFIKHVDVKDDKITISGIENITIIDETEKLEIKLDDSSIVKIDNIEEVKKYKDIFSNTSKGKLIAYSEVSIIFLTVSLVLLILMLNHLEKIFKNINKESSPFILDNVCRIKKIAYLMLFSVLASIVGNLILTTLIYTEKSLNFNAFSVMEILIVICLYYVFKYGYKLQLNSKSKIYEEEQVQ